MSEAHAAHASHAPREIVLQVDGAMMGQLLEAARELVAREDLLVLVGLVWAIWVRWEGKGVGFGLDSSGVL